MKKFAVFDIDGTLFRWQLFSDVVFELIAGGHLPSDLKAELDTKISEWHSRKHAHSFNEYEYVIAEGFAKHIKSIPVAAMEEAAEAVIARSGLHVYAYTKDLIRQLKADGYTLVAVSGSQNEIVQKFAGLWKFDIAVGQIIDAKDGIYTGVIPGDILVVFRKGEILKEIVEQNDLSWDGSIAVGDSKSDILMLELVKHPIAFNPSEELFAHAEKHGWKIVLERKNMIYELEQRNGTYLLENAGTR